MPKIVLIALYDPKNVIYLYSSRSATAIGQQTVTSQFYLLFSKMKQKIRLKN